MRSSASISTSSARGGVNNTRGTLLGRGLVSNGEMGGGGDEEGGGGLSMGVAASAAFLGVGAESTGERAVANVVAGGEFGRGDITKGVVALPGDRLVMPSTLAGEVGGVLGNATRAESEGGGGVEGMAGVGGEVRTAERGGGTSGGGGRLCCR